MPVLTLNESIESFKIICFNKVRILLQSRCYFIDILHFMNAYDELFQI